MSDSNQTYNDVPQPPIAFCQTCGKALDHETLRKVGPAVYCEPCLEARLHQPQPGPAQPGAQAPPPFAGVRFGANGLPIDPGQPNPGLAALLGLIPGVGAMYNEQYAKGIVHLLIFAVLTSLAHVSDFFLFVFGWIAYMSIEAHHTAKARLNGTPLPNPFGFNDIGERMGFGKGGFTTGPDVMAAARDAAQAAASSFNAAAAGFNRPNPTTPPTTEGWGAPVNQYPPEYPPTPAWGQPYTPPPVPPYGSTYVPPMPPMPPIPPLQTQPRFPAGAIWLIGLGMIFLLSTMGLFKAVPGDAFIGFTLLVIGIWVFLRRMTDTGQSLADDGSPDYRFRLLRAARGSVWLVVIGILWLLDSFRLYYWHDSWPWIIILIAAMMIAERYAFNTAVAAASIPTNPTAPKTPEGGN